MTTSLAMDRIQQELKGIDRQWDCIIAEMSICRQKGKLPESLYNDVVGLKERFADLLTLAGNWRFLAEANGIELGEDNE